MFAPREYSLLISPMMRLHHSCRSKIKSSSQARILKACPTRTPDGSNHLSRETQSAPVSLRPQYSQRLRNPSMSSNRTYQARCAAKDAYEKALSSKNSASNQLSQAQNQISQVDNNIKNEKNNLNSLQDDLKKSVMFEPS